MDRLAEEVGLALILDKSFHAFYEEHIKDPALRDLMMRLDVLDENGTFSEEEWEAIGVYKVFAFRKVGGARPKEKSSKAKEGSSKRPPKREISPKQDGADAKRQAVDAQK